MKIDFKGQKVLITGGNSNLGKKVIELLLKNNAYVYTTVTEIKKIKNLKNNNKNKIKFFELNYKNSKSVQNFINEVKKIDYIDVLINNAGINIIDNISNIKNKDWIDIQNVNLTGPFMLMREISKKMIKKKKGNILNISSIFGSVGKEKRSSYSSSKWGLIGLTKSASLDLAKYNILVNALSPGVINSSLTKKILGSEGIKDIKTQIPLRRLSNVEEIAKIILFLISNHNTYLTGQNIIVDGGYTCG